MFVSAALYCSDECYPSTVRNLSESGALVEAPVLPPVGSQIRLCRGSLVVTGTVVWRRGSKSGLKFDSSIVVGDWLPSRPRAGQAAVDEIVHQAKMGRAPAAPPAAFQRAAETRLPAQELEAIAALIDRVADAFTADADVITKHGWKLQQLEVAMQRIRRVAKAMPGSA